MEGHDQHFFLQPWMMQSKRVACSLPEIAKFSPCIYITIQAYLQMCFARRVSAQTLLYPSLTKTSYVLDGI